MKIKLLMLTTTLLLGSAIAHCAAAPKSPTSTNCKEAGYYKKQLEDCGEMIARDVPPTELDNFANIIRSEIDASFEATSFDMFFEQRGALAATYLALMIAEISYLLDINSFDRLKYKERMSPLSYMALKQEYDKLSKASMLQYPLHVPKDQPATKAFVCYLNRSGKEHGVLKQKIDILETLINQQTPQP